jgi:putative inorganic carbon (HCO3(-)) transporter
MGGHDETRSVSFSTRITRWTAYCLMTASLAAAVLLKGGVYPQQWVWSGLALSLAAILALTVGGNSGPGLVQRLPWGIGAMGVLLAWMAFQLVPLPPAVIERISPEHWHAVAAARAATGQRPGAWLSLSVSPSVTFERLLDVLPAMAAFVVTGDMAWWWRKRLWIAIAPVVGVAVFESVLGLAQFYSMRDTGGYATGTYVNRNHFAGLLGLAFPLTVVLAASTWRTRDSQSTHSARSGLSIAFLLVTSACLLGGVVVSLSRMGFISVLAGVGFTWFVVLMSRVGTDGPRRGWRRIWLWVMPVALPLLMVILLPTRALILRFADVASTQQVSQRDRIEIWRNTLQLISAYKWTGCGLGAFKQGFFQYQTVAPVNTVDFAHNDYLQIVAELGIPGSLLVAVLAGWIAARMLAVVWRRRNARNWQLAVGLFASIVTLAVHSLADFNLYIPANALALAWLGGVAVSPGLREP